MAQLLRVCVTSAEDSSSVPATHAKQIYSNWPSVRMLCKAIDILDSWKT